MSSPEPTIVSVNVSSGGIPKTAVDVGTVSVAGIVGDAHDHEKHNTPLQAISCCVAVLYLFCRYSVGDWTPYLIRSLAQAGAMKKEPITRPVNMVRAHQI